MSLSEGKNPGESHEACDVTAVLRAEHEYLRGESGDQGPLEKMLDKAEYWALCLSGGGIRSATFGLGVLQGLAERGLLGKFDYLSTVSGGGYIGSWLSSWISRTKDEGLNSVINQLASRSKEEPQPLRRLRAFSNYLSPVWGLSTDFFTLVSIFLRNLLLNWLVLLPLLAAALLLPRVYIGFLSSGVIDQAWVLGALSTAAVVAMMMGIAYVAADLPGKVDVANGKKVTDRFFLRCFLPIVVAAMLLSLIASAAAPAITEFSVYNYIVAGAGLHVLGWIFGLMERWRRGIDFIVRKDNKVDWSGNCSNFGNFAFVVLSGMVGGALLYWLAKYLPDQKGCPDQKALEEYRLLYAAFAVPALLFCFWLATTVYVGLVRLCSSEMDREWWARSGAWWLRAGLGWALLFVLVIYGPRWAFLIPDLTNVPLEALTTGSGVLGIAAGLIGYLSKNGAMLRRRAEGLAAVTGMRLLDLAAIVFILGLVVAFSYFESWSLNKIDGYYQEKGKMAQQPSKKACVEPVGTAANAPEADTRTTEWNAKTPQVAAQATAFNARAAEAAAQATQAAIKAVEIAERVPEVPPQVRATVGSALTSIANAEESAAKAAKLSGKEMGPQPKKKGADLAEEYAQELRQAHKTLLWAGGAFLVLLLISGSVSFVVGVNTFSLHSMYGNRLVRAYLGATNDKRWPHWFTGFDPGDNIAMHKLGNQPPGQGKLFHIVNVALNLAKPAGDRLEWQQRKAASFTISPLHAGSANNQVGYLPVKDYADEISLGRAMAISGAAASPNMGYHTSAPVAFIMTLFNIRLGWWQPNPGKVGRKTWGKREPTWGLRTLLSEALARSTEKNPYVYLSDGGHFDNLGLYEMVRRRCDKIVVVDASCDPRFEFGDLQDAIRKIRVDLGISIEFDNGLPTPEYARAIKYHYALGKILYPAADENSPEISGEICYIKPVLSGDEPLDVTRYAAEHADGASAFPHQTTADQFFDEAQFESYRMLGLHSVTGFPGEGKWPASVPKPPDPPVPPVPQKDGSDGFWSGLANAFGSMSQGALVASAITVGGVLGVSGTVALKDNTVTLKPDAAIGLREEDRRLLRDGLPLKAEESFKQGVLQHRDAINGLAGAVGALKETLPPIILIPGSGSTNPIINLKSVNDRLDDIKNALGKKEKVEDGDILKKLQEIREAILDIAPRRNIPGVVEGTQQ